MRYYADTLEIIKFRKISNQTIKLGTNVNVISGLNGVGKSNIMSMIAMMFGKSNIRIAGGDFFPQFDDYFIITKDEFNLKNEDKYTSYLKVSTNAESDNFIQKRLGLRDDSDSGRGIRIIPRGTNYFSPDYSITQINEIAKKEFGFGETARVPVPTIFISLARLFPMGETKIQEKNIASNNLLYRNGVIDKYIEWYNEIIPNSINKNRFQTQKIKKFVNKSGRLYVELLDASVETQSVGQDNLGSIVSSLVDFYYLKKISGKNYNGGLLCIDEIDASLHPAAQERLFDLLITLSEKLDLQIILTTHSLTILEKIFKYQKRDASKYKLNYIVDPLSPRVLKIDNYTTLKADLHDEVNYYRPKIKVYCEDDLTLFLFKELIKTLESLFVEFSLPEHEEFSMSLGKDQLKSLNRFDDYFNRVVMIVDGDARINTEQNQLKNYINKSVSGIQQQTLNNNVIALPTTMAPESYLYYVLYEIYHDDKFWAKLVDIPGTELYTKSRLLELLNKNTDAFKGEYISNKEIKSKVMNENIESIKKFISKTQLFRYYYSLEENKKEIHEYKERIEWVFEIVEKKVKANL